jgi:hypothetical protein
MNKEESLEMSLFDWEGWDEAGIMCICFNGITLKKDIGKHKKGDKFEWAFIDFEHSELTLGNNDEEEKEQEKGRFKLNLDVIYTRDENNSTELNNSEHPGGKPTTRALKAEVKDNIGASNSETPQYTQEDVNYTEGVKE